MAIDAARPLAEKIKRLRSIVDGYGSAAAAFSGGADSTLLAVICHEMLGNSFLAVTAESPVHVPSELRCARDIGKMIGFRHLVVRTNEMRSKDFSANRPDRCYHCKRHIFSKIRQVARKHGIRKILDGSNTEDKRTVRPGLRAAVELGVRSPLAEAELTKAEVRVLLKRRGLPNWDAPAQACLATRVPYGTRITAGILDRVRAAEGALADMGFKAFRVRHHGDIVRIELRPQDMASAVRQRRLIAEQIKSAGYRFVTLDLAGYQMGCFDS